ncbi:unnamed protein product [Cuscuta campestris]|nr:unnamed protein product [Cuscuta campestris]
MFKSCKRPSSTVETTVFGFHESNPTLEQFEAPALGNKCTEEGIQTPAVEVEVSNIAEANPTDDGKVNYPNSLEREHVSNSLPVLKEEDTHAGYDDMAMTIAEREPLYAASSPAIVGIGLSMHFSSSAQNRTRVFLPKHTSGQSKPTIGLLHSYNTAVSTDPRGATLEVQNLEVLRDCCPISSSHTDQTASRNDLSSVSQYSSTNNQDNYTVTLNALATPFHPNFRDSIRDIHDNQGKSLKELKAMSIERELKAMPNSEMKKVAPLSILDLNSAYQQPINLMDMPLGNFGEEERHSSDKDKSDDSDEHIEEDNNGDHALLKEEAVLFRSKGKGKKQAWKNIEVTLDTQPLGKGIKKKKKNK